MPPFSEGETEAHRRDTLHPGPQGESHQDFSAYLLVKGSNPPGFTTDRERKGASGLSTPLLLTFGAGGSLWWGLLHTSQDVQQRPWLPLPQRPAAPTLARP